MEKTKFTPKKWLPITEATENLEAIYEWKHPEYGIIKGSIIGGDRIPGTGGKVSLWILPDDGRSAEIWLGEFTGYRKALSVAK